MKATITFAFAALFALSSCDKALEKSYQKDVERATEAKLKQAEAEEKAKARDLINNVSLLRDLDGMAEKSGIDYPALLERALNKEKAAVTKLLWMAGNANLDGAASEGYSHSMVEAAKLIGDKEIHDAAKLLDESSRKALRLSFLFEYGFDSDPKTAIEGMKNDFPQLWSLIGENEE